MNLTDSVTLKQLRTLCAIRDAGSLAGAATRLNLTAPAVHTQLRKLEEQAGCLLVVRGGGAAARLTMEGVRLCEAQERIDAILAKVEAEIATLRDGHTGRVCLGVVSTGKYFAPGLVALVRRAHPGLDVVLKVGNRDEIVLLLQQGVVDLVIMGRPPRQPLVTAYTIGDHPHVMIAQPGHPLVGRRAEITAHDILSETIISREQGSGTRILMTRYLDRIGEGEPYSTIEMDSNETIKQAVMAGLGIALISQHTVIEELRAGRLARIDFGDLPILRHWFVLHDAAIEPSGAVKTVLDFVRDQHGAFLPQL
ncbi:LysR family transcriptional regulator [Brevirhabdus pacifica]|uniref:HTH-type transcriptional regulator CbbR n=1 Tax=Brevirhabdus pacifica TaxID=1267768 RepID=A0A1U7DGT7_9RHOB|nr:LysR family transcriptional regulator [Brevirhabdus pacifica]APX89088.1 LysR family transcriptional regulator [Brevirhabdus pacifica]OWU76850.1 LysR family transcriptional regulator [Loktanella sp. 22II-4b]PJJ86332.1 DNA-binding transcriptional LysR family regulator [Brevirhabdus pacifica]